MKSLLAAVLILSFAGVAVFSIFAMGHGGEQGHNGCFAATASGADCPGERDLISFLNFHLGVFKSFSLAIPSLIGIVGILFLLLALTLLRPYPLFGYALRPLVPLPRSRSRELQESSSLRRKQFTHWLALHENSPASL